MLYYRPASLAGRLIFHLFTQQIPSIEGIAACALAFLWQTQRIGDRGLGAPTQTGSR